MLEPCSGVASSLALICSDQILPYAILQLDLTVNFYKAPRLPHLLRHYDCSTKPFLSQSFIPNQPVHEWTPSLRAHFPHRLKSNSVVNVARSH